jgi:CheY-like chemotaxis protein
MPGMSGVEVANEAKRLRRGIKVLLTSGYARDVVAAQIADRDFRVVTKPYAQDDLATALGRLLRDETTDGGGVEAEPR